MGCPDSVYPSAPQPVLECQTMKSPSPEHWSKDFVEHLRTVHFALLGVSTGLMLLLFSKPYDARIAASQMSDVMRIRDDLSKNPASLVVPVLRENTLPLDSEGAISLENLYQVPYSPWFAGTSLGGAFRTEAKRIEGGGFLFHIAERNLYACPLYRSYRQLYSQPESLGVPKTIHEFKLLWQTTLSGGGVAFDSIDKISRRVHVSKGGIDDVDRIDITPVNSGGSFTAKSIDVALTGRCQTEPDTSLQLTGSKGEYKFVFTVVSINRTVINQTALQMSFSSGTGDSRTSDFRTGSFETAMSDLAKATRSTEQEDLDRLSSRIYAEATKGEEAFEAFGIRFPSEQVTIWGVLVLISVQLYFVMYLRRLSNKLMPDDPGREMPWVAMDAWWLARLMLFVSVVLLPLCAASFILLRFASQLVLDGWSWHLVHIFETLGFWDKVALILMLVGFCLSATLSILSWLYRPKLSEPSAPAQLFE